MTAIELIVTDLDGTLLLDGGHLPPRNRLAIQAARELGVGLILATGKTYQSAKALIRDLNLELPGVYAQGLIVCGARGHVWRDIKLDAQLAADIATYLEQQDVPYLAYWRDGLLAPYEDSYHELIHSKYGEPRPQIIGSLVARLDEFPINKVLIGDRHDVAARRYDLERRFGRRGRLLQAVPEYVEVLPPGVSKGAGVRWLLERLGVDPQAVLAIGDGENDIEMLQLAGLGVAVANARPEVQAAADAVVARYDQGGVAEAIERFVLAR